MTKIPPIGNQTITPSSTQGSTNMTVHDVQVALNEIYGPGTVPENGDFDAKTQQTIMRFQDEHGLTPTGAIDNDVIQMMNDEIARGPRGKNPVAGVYDQKPRVPDSTPLFDRGRFDPRKVLRNMTQFDNLKKTTTDSNRCGAAVLLAALINQDGKAGLIRATHKLEKEFRTLGIKDVARDMKSVRARLKNGTATYGDLALIQDAVVRRYGSSHQGISGPEMYFMFKEFGLHPPRSQRGQLQYTPGKTWPMKIPLLDTHGRPLCDENGEIRHHWVLLGKDPTGRPFAYDPIPSTETDGQVLPVEPYFRYAAAAKQIPGTSTGPPPVDEDVANQLLAEQYGE